MEDSNNVEREGNDLINLLENYVENNNPHLVILTPCFGSICYTNYINSLLHTQDLFNTYKIPLTVLFCKNDSLVTRARNNLIAKAMNIPTMTHMLFIDNDIAWEPFDIIKLLISNKPIIGGIYPLKKYMFNRIIPTENNTNPVKNIIDKKNNSELKMVSDTDTIQMNLLKYNVNYVSDEMAVNNNIAEVKHIATGFMLIKKNVIELMSESYNSTKYTDDVGFLNTEENNYAYALFDCGVINNHYYSEDWLFCHRWTNLNGSIYVDVTVNLTHTGINDFKGCYLSSIL